MAGREEASSAWALAAELPYRITRAGESQTGLDFYITVRMCSVSMM